MTNQPSISDAVMKVICIKHPKYNGEGSPSLTCRCCCAKYVHKIRIRQAFDAWKLQQQLDSIMPRPRS